MKYLSLFSGIGGFELGIQQAYENNISWKYIQESKDSRDRNSSSSDRNRKVSIISRKSATCIGYSEVDKYAIKTYEKNFNGNKILQKGQVPKQKNLQDIRNISDTSSKGDRKNRDKHTNNSYHKNYGDITTIQTKQLPDFDLLVGGFPCQSFSIAGKRKGFDDTRGTLFFDIARILADKKPKHLVLENVKGLLSHDGGKTFQTIIGVLTDLGYFVEWQVLNSKNFGVPQNRERVFIIGHLGKGSRPKVFPITETTQSSIKVSQRGKHQQDIVYKTDGIMTSLPAGTHGSTKHLTKIIKGSKIRRLTPTECERLQGFPDGWTDGVSDTQRYKQCGNAVTTNVVKAIMERLL